MSDREVKDAAGKPGRSRRAGPRVKRRGRNGTRRQPGLVHARPGGGRGGLLPGPRPAAHRWRFIDVADRFGFLSDERTEATHVVERPDDTVPLYRLMNTCRAGRYAIEKTIYTHPKRDVLIQECVITLPPAGSDGLRRMFRLDPRLSGDAAQDDAAGSPITRAGR